MVLCLLNTKVLQMNEKKLKYGVYTTSLSIGFAGADQEDDLDLSEYYTKEQWDAASIEEQEEFIRETTVETLGQTIEYGYKYQKAIK